MVSYFNKTNKKGQAKETGHQLLAPKAKWAAVEIPSWAAETQKSGWSPSGLSLKPLTMPSMKERVFL